MGYDFEKQRTPEMRHPELAAEIIDMAERDQDMREANFDDPEFWDDSVDRGNTARMKDIIGEIGWPTVSKVGKEASGDAWLLVQHADRDPDFQRLCLELMRQEPAGEVAPHDIAYLTDRVRVNSGEPQVYGTQFTEIDGELSPRPIEDPERVDERRKELGLPTLEENVAMMREKYESNDAKKR